MSFYQTQIKSVRAGYAVDTQGKRLSFIGNYPCQAGDFVWTDGKFIFGNISSKPQQTIFNKGNSGIPILAADMRGYFNPNGDFKNFPVAEKLSDEDLEFDWWFINGKRKFFVNTIFQEQTEPYEDIEITDDDRAFAISDFIVNNIAYFEVADVNGATAGYFFKSAKDFVDDSDTLAEIKFLKLQKGNDRVPVKWFAVIATGRSGDIYTKTVTTVDRYKLTQNKEESQEISLTQPGIWTCEADITKETVPVNIRFVDTHEEIFTIDSDGNKKIIYKADTTSPADDPREISNQKIEAEEIYEVWRGYGPSTMAYDNFSFHYVGGYFTGNVTIEWVAIGISEDTIEGTRFRVVSESIPFDSLAKVDTKEIFNPFTYPVQDGFYISANDIHSTLRLFNSDDELILDFANSGDEYLASLTGFHNFAATLSKRGSKTEREYLLTIHDAEESREFDNKFFLWKIKNFKATKLSDACYNYRFYKMRDIRKARK